MKVGVLFMSKKCYIYSINKGEFEKLKGEIHTIVRCGAKLMGRFKNDEKSLNCHIDEGVVFNGCVWFEKENDELAKEKIIEFEYARIEKMKQEIKNTLILIKKIES
jgi:exosome complex RNA-binding protein Rrp4